MRLSVRARTRAIDPSRTAAALPECLSGLRQQSQPPLHPPLLESHGSLKSEINRNNLLAGSRTVGAPATADSACHRPRAQYKRVRPLKWTSRYKRFARRWYHARGRPTKLQSIATAARGAAGRACCGFRVLNVTLFSSSLEDVVVGGTPTLRHPVLLCGR